MLDNDHERFARAAHPLNWYEVAQLLHENARTLHESPQGTVSQSVGEHYEAHRTSSRAVFLLSAFALENLIKAFLIYENPRYIEGGKLSKELLNMHGLSKLQKMCKRIPSPIRTRHVFETLEVGVNSWARYPCATSVNRESVELTVTPEFWNTYCFVFDLYSERLEGLLEKNWVGPHGIGGCVEFKRYT